MKVFVPVAAVIFLVAALAPATAVEKPNCHSYDAADPNPKVQREFGTLFRQGYQIATICGDQYGPLRYLVGDRPKKEKLGICGYGEREVYRVDIDGKISWRNAPPGGETSVESRKVSFSEGTCPAYGDESYVPIRVADDVLFAVLTFWKGVRAENVEQAFSSAQIFNYQDFNFIAEMKAAFAQGGPHIQYVIDRRADNARWPETAKRPPYEISVRTVGDVWGWNIGGDVVGGVFAPRSVGFWIE